MVKGSLQIDFDAEDEDAAIKFAQMANVVLYDLSNNMNISPLNHTDELTDTLNKKQKLVTKGAVTVKNSSGEILFKQEFTPIKLNDSF